MGKRQPKKVLNLGNKNKKTTPKPRELYVYTYCHICEECGNAIKEIKSHKVLSETEGTNFCLHCQKEVRSTIQLTQIVVPKPRYSSSNSNN